MSRTCHAACDVVVVVWTKRVFFNATVIVMYYRCKATATKTLGRRSRAIAHTHMRESSMWRTYSVTRFTIAFFFFLFFAIFLRLGLGGKFRWSSSQLLKVAVRCYTYWRFSPPCLRPCYVSFFLVISGRKCTPNKCLNSVRICLIRV